MKALLCLGRFSLVFLTILISTAPARANVYATNIKLNGASQQAATAFGNAVAVSYILSDDADLGVTVNVYSNAAVIRTFTVGPGALATNGAGLSRGTNQIFWDGSDANGQPVGSGAFGVSVTAAGSGHADWTLLTTNAINTSIRSGGYYTYAPRGLAVNTVTNSPYYGRVFVGNAATGFDPDNVAGDNDAILKFNADGSAADDGAFGTGGYPMSDANYTLPEKLRTSDDGRLYMNDRHAVGQVVAFDGAVATSEVVLNPFNYFSNPYYFTLQNGLGWFSMDVTAAGSATNGLIWLGEYDEDGAGVWFWHMTNGIADPNDETGVWAISAGGSGSLGIDASGGLMVDARTNVFVSQYIDAVSNNAARCMMFTNVSGAAAATNAAWTAGASDDTFLDIFDTTIDSRAQPRFVACAMSGPTVAGLRILSATNGATIATNLDSANTYFATAWDNVGNLYAASDSLQAWRVWSPPGGVNSATTLGLATVQTVRELTILSAAKSGNALAITFTATYTNAPGNFTLLSSTHVPGTFAPAVNYAITKGAAPGLYIATATNSGPTQFYLIKH